MTDIEKINSRAPGTAKIKTEFVVQDHIRELNLNFVANKDKRANNDSADEPARKKLKGQNKHRPREKRVPRAEKLCFKMGTEGSCPFGDSCCYSHDIVSYLDKKLPDISNNCYLYETFGKCPYSFSCRFASIHLKDGKNLVNDDVVEKYKNVEFYRNNLQKEIQRSLRNRSYDFKRSNEAIERFELMKASFKQESVQVDTKSENTELSNEALNLIKIVKPEVKQEITDVDSKGKVSDLSNETLNLTKESEKPEVKQNSIDVDINDKTSELNNEVLNLTEKIEEAAVVHSAEHKSKEPNGIQKKSEDELNLSEEKPLDSTGTLIGTIIDDDKKSGLSSANKKIDFKDKLYLAPLTTVGNLPFRRICKEFGADITCSEMAMSLSLLQGQQSEWALLKRHHTEDIFGIQLCGAHPDLMTRCSQLLSETTSFDFIDLNLGCPLDMVYKKGGGCGLMNRLRKLEGIIYGVNSVIDVPLTLKMRTGIYGGDNIAHNVIKKIHQWKDQISLITIHGRSREQRYTKSANWNYINFCNELAGPIPLFGNGDVLTFEDYNRYRKETDVAGAMIARGALIKPWIFKEIKEQRHWDISSSERLEILRRYSNYGLEHWGSDSEGVEKCRRFLLEWLSFLYRYIPVGLLESPPQRINERPPPYVGRNDLETLMASPSCNDWVKISEMLLGPVPENFVFLPKHKANAYQ